MKQLRLYFGRDKDSIRSYLEEAIRKSIALTITDNATSMISCRHAGDTLLLRMHRMFLTAGLDVLDELAALIKRRKRKTPLITSFINDNGHQVRRGLRRSMTLRTQGRHYDLRDLFDAINAEYFDGRLSAGITWGSKGPRRHARSRTLGVYLGVENMIRINPVLDSRSVPKYFLAFVIYHEMIHADMGIEQKERKRSVHSKEFRKREKMFRHYERAMKWERFEITNVEKGDRLR